MPSSNESSPPSSPRAFPSSGYTAHVIEEEFVSLCSLESTPQNHSSSTSNSMGYNTRTGQFTLDGPAGLALGAISAFAFLLGQTRDDSDERRRRVDAERREAEAKEQQQAAETEREEARQRAEEAERARDETAEALKLEEELRRLGMEPDRVLTEEDIRIARRAVQYVPDKMNIGVVGRQNEGKSTLVNCLRGIKHDTGESARVGEAEVTWQSTPYPDRMHPGFLWHDIPGGGTRQTSAWGYYFDQKLYAYDKLVLVHTSTLSELDLKILQIGKHRSQECIVVRTKADDHIRNCKRNRGHTTAQEAREDYIRQVREDTEEKNKQAGKARDLCPHYIDYIISEMGVMQVVTGTSPSEDPYEQVVDENELLRKLGLTE